MVSQEIGHSSVVMTETYAKFILRKLGDDSPSSRNIGVYMYMPIHFLEPQILSKKTQFIKITMVSCNKIKFTC